ncbi:MAG: hypothetical protein MJ109_03960 [Kiritimatiellae bacterium]|nr:hypothetical protein [Kiritimatiellia bacterium]
MIYEYLYQDRENNNLKGEIKARNRAEAYAAIRKLGIRPYRVIGDDPKNWRPWAIAGGYVVMTLITLVACYLAISANLKRHKGSRLSEEQAVVFRERCEDAVMRAPEAYRYNVWKGVNARLEEQGLAPLERPADMVEDLEFR